MAVPGITASSDATFGEDVLTSTTPVLVEFGAAWCAPCRMVAPVLQQIARDEGERLRVVTVDVDDSPVTAMRYQVQGMPTLILFKDGLPVTTLVGAHSRSQIVERVEPYL